MNTQRILTFALFPLFLCSACLKEPAPGPSPFPSAPAATLSSEKAQRALSSMSDRLWKELSQKPGNLVYSPASIAIALAMTTGGTASATETQLLSAFGLGLDDAPGMHAAFGNLLMTLSGPELAIANRLWAQKDFGFLDSFLALTRDHYGAELQKVDFSGDTEGARQAINQWIEKQTRDKIKDLLKPGVLNPLTRMVLTNAIYFKAKWEKQFRKEDTRSDTFYLSEEKTSKAMMMSLRGKFRYAENPDEQLLELPYQGGRLSALILLPKARNGIKETVSRFTSTRLASLSKTQNTDMTEVDLSLPRFTFRFNADLNGTLQKMGIRDAFSPEAADFSKMDGKKDLYLTNVVHEAFIEVNEEGTEAAAATAAVVGIKSIVIEEPPVVFRADHPFLFLIRDNASGALLFIARVDEPTRLGK